MFMSCECEQGTPCKDCCSEVEILPTADEKAGYPPNCNKGYKVSKDGKSCVKSSSKKKKGYAELQKCDACETPEMCAEKGCLLMSNEEASCECENEKCAECGLQAGTPCKDCGAKCECVTATEDCCPVGEEMIDGVCQRVSVTLECQVNSMEAIVEASTGNTIIEIRGVAFHEGTNKNGWEVTPEGARSMVHQMQGADLTLNHPDASEHGIGFTRNMDGGVNESKVGTIYGASYHATIDGGYEVRYIAHVVRHELFEALESGVWTNTEDYGVSIGGSGVPIAAEEEKFVFGEDFTFDHLAIVHKPAYERASIENVKRIEKPMEIEATFIAHSDTSETSEAELVKAMTDENETTNFEEEIESLKADLVLASSRVSEFEAADNARIESERVELVEKASGMGMTGHEDLKTETIERLIASWESAHPEPDPVVMESVESVASDDVESVEASEKPRRVVANFLNGVKVESDEDIYARCWNAWAKAWNGTLTVDEKNRMAAPKYDAIKEMY